MQRGHSVLPLQSWVDVRYGWHVVMPWRTHLRPDGGDACVIMSKGSFVWNANRVWKKRPRLSGKAKQLSAPRPLVDVLLLRPNRPLTTFIEQRQRTARQPICHYRELRRVHIYM